MKFKSFVITFLCFLAFAIPSAAQAPQEVTLTVSSDGPTKEDATKNALRSAIEQAYGAFVSANTTILNDELVKDEIVTVSNGSIKEYKEISAVQTDNGNHLVTLSATVSLPHLITYAQSHGSECEFAGNTFGMEIKLWELNKESELKVLMNLQKALDNITYICNYEFVMEEPRADFSNHDMLSIGFTITPLANANTQLFFNQLFSVLESLSVYHEVKSYDEYDNLHEVYWVNATGPKSSISGSSFGAYLRNSKSIELIEKIFESYNNKIYTGFILADNLNSPTRVEYKLYGHREDSPYKNRNCHVVWGGIKLKDLNKTIDQMRHKYKKQKKNVFIFPQFLTVSQLHGRVKELRLCVLLEFNLSADNKHARTKAGEDIKGRILIPKEDIGKYSKFRVEPKE